ncbi:family 43 glycosylhydrolase [Paenibacillus terricola]|nr:family 43 glycosylhydrolase [Paenibacillus terricola]
MNRKWLSLLLTLVLLVSLIPVSPIFAEKNVSASNNPVIWADVPDPDVIRVGNAYYMTSTTMHMNPGVPIMKSYDLIHWEIVNYVYDVLGDDEKQTLSSGQNEYGKGSWASSLRYNNGKYYVTFSSSTTGKTYIFQTTDIEHGPWTKSELGFHHDMSLLFDDDGRVYLVDGGGDIRITELNADATAVKPGGLDQVIIPNASLAAGNNVGLAAEGSHIQKINGKYYVFLITWPTGGMRTELVFRSDSIAGPYEGRVALQDQGIAQGGIIDTVNGDWYALLFGDRGAVGRIPYLVPVTWTDGWPVFGAGGKVPATIDTGLPSNGITTTKIAASDEFYQNASHAAAYHTVVKPKASVSTQPAPSSSTGGTEILVNGGFENEQDASWVGSYGAAVAATDTEHSSGSKALLVSGRTLTGDGPKQVTTGKIQTGVTYRFSAKVKYTSGPDTKPFNFDIQHGPSWQGIKILGSKTIAKGEWGTIEGTYTVPADADISQTFIFIETPWVQTPDPTNDLMDFYVDDVSMLDTSVSELIDNGNAEAGLAPWMANGAAAASLSDAEHYSGAYSILTTGRKATGDGAKQVITGEVTAGATYQFSAKVKYTSGPDQKQFNFDIQNGPSWQGIKILGSKTIKKGEWGTVEGTYTLPADADISETFIFLETPWTGTPDPVNDLMDFYVDDVSFVQKALPAAVSAKNGENDDNGSNLALVWQWNHNPDNNNWSLTDRPGYLRLTTGRKSTTLLDARNTLTQRSFGPESSGAIAVDVSRMKDGDYAGLAALQAKYGFVGVNMAGGTRSIVMVDGSGAAPVEAASVPLAQDRVYFKIDMDFKNQADNAAFYYSLDGITWVRIGNALHMQYTLPHFMGYRFALFNYATKATGGYVDFDYFRISDKLTGASAPAAVLQADLGDVSDVVGVPNMTLQVPITLSALPKGKYSSINASFSIPKELSVSNVVFNPSNIAGSASYTYADHRLQIKLDGNQIHVKGGLFATIMLKVEAFATSDHTASITTDYINVEGGDVVYDVQQAVAEIGLKQLNTGAIGKLPGYSNPLMSHKFGADPYALVYNGRVYVYMTNDAYEYDSNGNIKDNTYGQIKTINVISSADMVNWTDHGAIPVAGANGAAKWAGLSWAPAAAHKVIDGKDKFFLYFANGAGGIGVLTADSPTGPWTDPIGGPLVSFATEGVGGVVWLFDPAVLVDDNGSAYLYFGGGIPNNPTAEQAAHPNTARVIRLADDMVHTVGAASAIDAPYMFEDSGIHKYNGKYYYSYCSNFAGTHPDGMPPAGEIAYMVSDSPMGPFTYVGSILKNPGAFFGVGGNNHHAIFEFNNEWYVVYHAQTLSKAALGEGKGYRSTHINKVQMYEDGSIKSIQADMEGVAPVAALNPYQRTEAETIAWQAGIATEPSTAPAGSSSNINLDVTNISNGDWVAVSNVDFGDKGAASFTANVAGNVGGKIEIRLDSPIGQVIGTLNVKSTGGDQSWKLLQTEVAAVGGVHNVFLMFQGGDGSKLLNLDYWQFTAAGSRK